MPAAHPTEHVVHGSDGWALSVLDLRPAQDPSAVVVAGHAMMVDRRTLYRRGRPCLATSLCAAGLRVLVPDVRGRGASGPTPAEGADWTFDDLVSDVAAHVRLAQQLEPDLPVVLVGHSLSALTLLAYLGRNPDAPIAAGVALTADLWQPHNEPSRGRWAIKRATFALLSVAVRLAGYVPARLARFGTADEARGYWRGFARLRRGDPLLSDDGSDDAAVLGRVACPVLVVVSDGDRLYANPESALRATAGLGERRTVLRIPDRETPGLEELAPTHMGIVTDPACEALWAHVGAWIVRRVASADE